ncbi:MAG: ABC transporter permease [Patescibacteria group bacterium]|nr:ABC transporter permease [Patescibacteria group bacterium]
MKLISFKIAITAMKRNKTRTFLTILGIVIGIAAVVAVMSAGQGIKGFVLKEIEMYGNDTIQTEIKVPSTGRNSTDNATALASGVEVTTLTLEDEQAIRKLSNIKNTYAGSIGQQLASYGSEKKQAMLYGVGPLFVNIDKTKLAAGRFFTEEEDRSLASVVVLGPKIKDELFGPGNDFLEKWIKIGRQKFMVIGVMESRGASFGFDMDEMIYMPIQTLQKKIMGVDHVMYVLSQVVDPKLTDQTASEITDLLRERHNITDPAKDDFAVTPMTEAISMINTVFWGISLLLVAVAGISLVVGGVVGIILGSQVFLWLLVALVL